MGAYEGDSAMTIKVTERLTESWLRLMVCAAVLVAFCLHASFAWRLDFLERVEHLAYDLHLRWTMPGGIDESVVIVDIDERSLDREGRWPWPRNKLAQLVERLFEDYHVEIVGFDIVFAEPDESSGLGVLEHLSRNQLLSDDAFQQQMNSLRSELDYDATFAESISQYPVVLGYYFNMGGAGAVHRSGALPSPLFQRSVFQGRNVRFLEASGFGGNLSELAAHSAGQGHFTQQPDQDGVVRRVPMLLKFEDNYYGSLALEIVRQVLGQPEVIPIFEKPLFKARGYPGLEWLRVANNVVPVDRSVQALVPYRGRQGSFPYVSATDILSGEADPKLMKNKIILVGTSAPGLNDLRTVSVQEAYPGVEVHANLVSGILQGRMLQFPEYTIGAEVVLLVVFGLMMALAGILLAPLATSLFGLSSIAIFVGLNHFVWINGVVLPIASGVMLLLALFVVHMTFGYFLETRGRQQLTGLFGQYVPRELVDEMSRSPDDYSLAAESRELTVLFSDVRGFTALSEGLSPQDLSELMGQYLTPMTEEIHRNRGTIDKYIGDAIMAFWGAPLADSDHPRHAVQAALAMVKRLEEINQSFRARGWPEIRIGIGINSGQMSVGNMGSSFRMAYTVLGDAVNLGSRLEGLTKAYGVSVICSEFTAKAIPEYVFREVDRVRVKGRSQPVGIFEPVCLAEELNASLKKELRLHAETLRLYRAQEWDTAELNFLNLSRTSEHPDLYQVYVERIHHFRRTPPPNNWDGVFAHATK